MATWKEVESQVPELAALAREFFGVGIHKTLATLRRDGAPRISGSEANFGPEDLWFGSMPGSLKALDLRRDPRFALHSRSEDPPAWKGDAKLSGRAIEVTDPTRRKAVLGETPDGGFPLFVADIQELSVVSLADSGDHLVVEWWNETSGYSRTERS